MLRCFNHTSNHCNPDISFFTARRQNYQTLFIGLSASSYVIAGAVSSAIIKIYTGNSIWAIIGSIAVHFVILVFLSFTIRKPCLRFQEKGYEKGWWKMCLIPIFFTVAFPLLHFSPTHFMTIQIIS